METVEMIIPPKLPKGIAISLGKRRAKFIRETGGINKDLLGPIQP